MHFVTRFCSLVSCKINERSRGLLLLEEIERAVPLVASNGSHKHQFTFYLGKTMSSRGASGSISSLFYDSFAFTFNCLSIKVQGAKNWHFIVHHDSNDQIYTYILYYQDWILQQHYSPAFCWKNTSLPKQCQNHTENQKIKRLELQLET